jgi:hypothetical protein
MTTSRARLLPLLAVGAITVGISLPAIAGAQEYPGPTDTTVPASSTTVAPEGSTVPTTDPAPNATATLPFTGGDVVGLLTIGLGALGGGYALMRSGARRPSSK